MQESECHYKNITTSNILMFVTGTRKGFTGGVVRISVLASFFWSSGILDIMYECLYVITITLYECMNRRYRYIHFYSQE